MLKKLFIEDREFTALNIISIILSLNLNIVMGIFVGLIVCCFTFIRSYIFQHFIVLRFSSTIDSFCTLQK